MKGHLNIEVENNGHITIDVAMTKIGFAEKAVLVNAFLEALNMDNEEAVFAVALRDAIKEHEETIKVDLSKFRNLPRDEDNWEPMEK